MQEFKKREERELKAEILLRQKLLCVPPRPPYSYFIIANISAGYTLRLRQVVGCCWISRSGFRKMAIGVAALTIPIRRTGVRSVSLPEPESIIKAIISNKQIFLKNRVVTIALFPLNATRTTGKHFLTFINNYHCNYPCKNK